MNNTLTNVKTLIGGAKAEEILSDTQLTEFINDSTNVYLSASKAAFAIANYYAHLKDTSVGPLSIIQTKRATEFRNLGIEYQRIGETYTDASLPKIRFIGNHHHDRNNIFSKDMRMFSNR